jgi:hypothetical protein
MAKYWPNVWKNIGTIDSKILDRWNAKYRTDGRCKILDKAK